MKSFIYYDIKHLTSELIRRVRVCMSKEDVETMKQRRDDIIDNLRLSTHEAKLLARDMFEKGYVAGNIELKESRDIVIENATLNNGLICRNCNNTGLDIFDRQCVCGGQFKK